MRKKKWTKPTELYSFVHDVVTILNIIVRGEVGPDSIEAFQRMESRNRAFGDFLLNSDNPFIKCPIGINARAGQVVIDLFAGIPRDIRHTSDALGDYFWAYTHYHNPLLFNPRMTREEIMSHQRDQLRTMRSIQMGMGMQLFDTVPSMVVGVVGSAEYIFNITRTVNTEYGNLIDQRDNALLKNRLPPQGMSR